jgi:hypothetical protein
VNQLPANGKIFLPDAGAPGAELLDYTGILDPTQVLRQYAVDIVSVSSYWPGGAGWHPLQILGPQGAKRHGTVAEADHQP